MAERVEQKGQAAYLKGMEEGFLRGDSTRKLTGPVSKFSSTHNWSPPKRSTQLNIKGDVLMNEQP